MVSKRRTLREATVGTPCFQRTTRYEPDPRQTLSGRLPPPASPYPLALRFGRTLNHFHAFYDHGRMLPTLAEADPEPRLWISPADASRRGISDSDTIRMFNDRGEMKARASVTDRVPPGTVWMRDGWEGLNTLTSGAALVPDAAVDLFETFSSGQAEFEAGVDVAAA